MARAGVAYVEVLPSLSGFVPAVRRGTAVPLAAAGRTAGTEYSRGLMGAVRSGLGGMSSTVARETRLAADQAAAAVNEATAKVVGAKKREADSIGAVRLAEEKLAAARRAGGGVATEKQAIAITGAEERLARATRTAAGATDTATLASDRLVIAQDRSIAATREAGLAAETSGGRFGRMATGVAGGADRMGSKIGHFAKQAAGMAGIFAGFEAAKFAGESFKAASDFQRSTNVLVTAADESTKNLKVIRSGIIDISNQTGTGVDHLSEGMYTIEKAGIRGASGLQVLRAAAKGAREENADLGTVTGAMTSIMASYHIPASKSANVMNALATAAGASKTSMQNFAGSLSTVLPLASANKIAFADVAGAIGTLTSHGTSADQATQELAFAIRGLSAPNAVAVKEMGQLGINAQDVSQNLGKRGLTGTMDYLSETVLKKMGPSGKVLLNTFYQSKTAGNAMTAMLKAMDPESRKLAQGLKDGSLSYSQFGLSIGKMTGAQRSQLSQFRTLNSTYRGFNLAIRQGLPGTQTYSEAIKKMTGGANGLNVALQLGGESQTGTKARVDAISKSMGTAKQFNDRWNSTSKTTAVQLDRAKMSVKNAGMEIATNLLPAVSKMASGFASAVLGVTSFTKQNWGWLKWVAGAILATVVALKVWNVVSRTAALLQLGFAAATGTATIATEEQTVATRLGALAAKGIAAAQWLWNAAMDANPIGLIVLAIVAFGAAIIVLWNKFPPFRRAVEGAWNGIKAATKAVVDWWTNTAWPDIKKFFGWITDGFKSVGSGISTGWKNVKGFFSDGVGYVTGFFKKHWMLIAAIILGPVATAAYEIYTHWNTITGYFSAAWTWVTKWLSKSWNGLSALIMAPINNIKTWMAQFWDAEKKGWTNIWNWVTGWISKSWNTLSTLFMVPINDVRKWVGQFWADEKTGWGKLWSWFTGWISKSWNGLTSLIMSPINAAKGAISDVFGKNGIQKIFSGALTAIGKIWDGLKAIVRTPIVGVVKIANAFVGGFNSIGHLFGLTIPKIPDVPQFHTGGYTGDGGKYEPKGVVHGGEYVIRKESTQRIERERPGFLAGLNGYASGGQVPTGGKPLAWSGLENYRPGMEPTLETVGRYLLGRNYAVIEHPKFGGVTPGAHSAHSLHYLGNAIDVSGGAGPSSFPNVEAIASRYGLAYKGPGYEGHSNHVHIDTSFFDSVGSHLQRIGGNQSLLGKAVGAVENFAFKGLANLINGPLSAFSHRFKSPFASTFLTGAVKKLLTGAVSFGNSSGSGSSGGPAGYSGGTSADFNKWWGSAIGVAGKPWARYKNATETVAKNESGFNPNAVNNWDSNAKAGHPSRGLMQFVPSTFNQWEWPGHTSLMNPVDQILAFFRYSTGVYGSPDNVPGVRSIGAGGKYRGYWTGTDHSEQGWANLGERGPELVMAPQTRYLQAGTRVLNAQDTARALSGGGPVDLTDRAAAKIAAAMSGLGIHADGRQIAHVVDPHLGQLQALAGQVG